MTDAVRSALLAATVVALAACGTGDGNRDAAATASATATATPTAATSSSPAPTPATWELARAYLPPDVADRAEQPGWEVVEPYEPEAGPVLDPCGEERFPGAEHVVDSGEEALGSTREAGGSSLTQEVFRYSSAETAAEAFDAYAAAVEGCPEVQPADAPEGYTTRHTTVAQEDVEGVRRLLVQRQPCMPGGGCTEHFRSYLLVAQTGDGLTVAAYGIGEDGDPREWAGALLEALAARLAAAVPDA